MRFFSTFCIVFLMACSSGSGDNDKDTSSPQDMTAGEVIPEDLSPADNLVEADLVQPVTYPEPADPIPTPQSGTFDWSDGVDKVAFAVNDGKVFLLESSFSCIGETGCKVMNEFTKLTCNKAYEKGYYAPLLDGVFVIEGIKGSDRLYGALQSDTSIALVYDMTPSVSCCKKSVSFTATWKLAEDCSDFASPDCDIYTDENCEPGANCYLGVGNKPVCTAAGEVEVGGECSTQGACSDGVCMGLSGVEGQHCHKYCMTDSNCPWGANCLSLEGEPYKVCSLTADQFETCNLLQQDCESPTDGCFYASSTVSKPICMPAGEGEGSDPCEGSGDCKKGYDCIANKSCLKICNKGGGDPECDSVFANCSNHYPPQNAGYCGE